MPDVEEVASPVAEDGGGRLGRVSRGADQTKKSLGKAKNDHGASTYGGATRVASHTPIASAPTPTPVLLAFEWPQQARGRHRRRHVIQEPADFLDALAGVRSEIHRAGAREMSGRSAML